MEKSAKEVRGFLLYNPFTEKQFFRVYADGDKKTYTDYKLAAEDIEIPLRGNGLSLFETTDGNRLDWSSK
jgi:hypothetical protein